MRRVLVILGHSLPSGSKGAGIVRGDLLREIVCLIRDCKMKTYGIVEMDGSIRSRSCSLVRSSQSMAGRSRAYLHQSSLIIQRCLSKGHEDLESSIVIFFFVGL